MQDFRNEKIQNRIRELSAIFIAREASPASLITVTGVDISPDSKYAKILISVLPREKEKAAYGFIKRNLGEMREYIKENLNINPIPFLDVAIDEGEKSRQKIDELLFKSN
ncbi:MAG: ribosome-binding factor A [bacterium]